MDQHLGRNILPAVTLHCNALEIHLELASDGGSSWDGARCFICGLYFWSLSSLQAYAVELKDAVYHLHQFGSAFWAFLRRKEIFIVNAEGGPGTFLFL